MTARGTGVLDQFKKTSIFESLPHPLKVALYAVVYTTVPLVCVAGMSTYAVKAAVVPLTSDHDGHRLDSARGWHRLGVAG